MNKISHVGFALRPAEKPAEALLHRGAGRGHRRPVLGEPVTHARAHPPVLGGAAVEQAKPLDDRLPGIGRIEQFLRPRIEFVDALFHDGDEEVLTAREVAIQGSPTDSRFAADVL